LSSDLCREWCGGLPGVDVVMAGGADDEGFASSSGHDCCPRGLGRAEWSEIGEGADVMDVHGSGLLAELALSRKESGDDFLAGMGDSARAAVVDDRGLLPFQGDAAEPCDQWFSACSLRDGLEACAWPGRSHDGGPVIGRDLGH